MNNDTYNKARSVVDFSHIRKPRIAFFVQSERPPHKPAIP